jgi:hypothetical protein
LVFTLINYRKSLHASLPTIFLINYNTSKRMVNNKFRLSTLTFYVKDILGALKMLRVTLGAEIIRIEFDPIDGLVVFIKVSENMNSITGEYKGVQLRILQESPNFLTSQIAFTFRGNGITCDEVYTYLESKHIFARHFNSPYDDVFSLESIPKQEIINGSKQLLFEKNEHEISFDDSYRVEYCNLLLSSSFKEIEVTVPSLSWYIHFFENILGYSPTWHIDKYGENIAKFLVDPFSDFVVSFKQDPLTKDLEGKKIKFFMDSKLTNWQFIDLLQDFPDEMYVNEKNIGRIDDKDFIEYWSILDENGFEWSLHNTNVFTDLNEIIANQL